jgi:hypothetical protein
MEDIVFWDCNARIGLPAIGGYARCATAADLLAEMDWIGVARALVHHALMLEQSPVVGNAALVQAIAGQPRLVGSWALLPPQTAELPIGDAFFAAMKREGIRALWACPRLHRYRLTHSTMGQLLDEVSERRIPLFVRRDAGGSEPEGTYDLLDALLRDYPELTLVLTGSGSWGEDRFFRPLLERYRRFFLDVSRYELDCGLRELVARYGPERLLFGSNYPETAMGGAYLMVRCAELDLAARRAIAGGNLQRLLQEVQL